MTLNLRQIKRKASLVDIDKAQYVRVLQEQIKYRRRGLVRFITETLPKRGEKINVYRKHEQLIYPADRSIYKGSIINCPAIKISCNCERWLFYYEVAGYKAGIADIIYSNGEPPVHTNPSLKVGLCGHLVKVLSYIEKNNI